MNQCENCALRKGLPALHRLAHELDWMLWGHAVRGARGEWGVLEGEATEDADGVLLLGRQMELVREVMQEAIDRISGAEYERNLLTAPEWSHMTDENWIKHVREQYEGGRASASVVKRYEAMRANGLICQQLDE